MDSIRLDAVPRKKEKRSWEHVLLYDKRSKIDEIYHEVADTKFPEAYDEKKWEKISLSFVTECAKQICKFFNLDFRRLK